jgi:transposase
MIDKQLLPGGIEVSAEDLAKTPPSVLKLLMYLLEENLRLKKGIEELEARLNQDSSNSNRPPSSDSPFKKESSGKVEKKSKAKSRKRRKGYRQQMLDPILLSPSL